VILSYPGIGGDPIILTYVECLLTGERFPAKMLLDTGASESCFPAAFASKFKHSNQHRDVKVLKDAVRGIGGFSDAYLHSVRVSLIHPSKSSKKKIVLAWEAGHTEVQFVEKFEDCDHGLIGMDIMKQWEEVRFEPHKSGVMIRITI
jgi:hypothetical protein